MIKFIKRLLGLESKEEKLAQRRHQYMFTGKGQLQYKANNDGRKKDSDKPIEINGRIVIR